MFTPGMGTLKIFLQLWLWFQSVGVILLLANRFLFLKTFACHHGSKLVKEISCLAGIEHLLEYLLITLCKA